MNLVERIVVMNKGTVEQIGTPDIAILDAQIDKAAAFIRFSDGQSLPVNRSSPMFARRSMSSRAKS